MTAISLGMGLIIVYFNFMYFSGEPEVFGILNIIAAGVALTVPILFRYDSYSKAKKIEVMFPIFLSDVTENLNAGMTLPQAIRNTSTNDYGALSPYVKEMSAKIEWGISFEKCLDDFAKKSGSPVMKRAVKTIIEAHRSGGTVNTVLEAVVGSVQEMERIKKERSARIYSQMVTGYFIFILFLGVMIGMSKFLIPAFAVEGMGLQGSSTSPAFYTELFRNLIVIQGIFAGIGIGKMAEGTVVAGLKHSFGLAVIGYTAFALFG